MIASNCRRLHTIRVRKLFAIAVVALFVQTAWACTAPAFGYSIRQLLIELLKSRFAKRGESQPAAAAESARGSLRGQCGLALLSFPGQDDSAVRVRLGRASAPEPAGLRNVTRTDASFANAVHPKLNILPCRTVQVACDD